MEYATSKPFAVAVAYAASKSEPDLMYAFAQANKSLDPVDRADGVLILGRGLIVWASEPDGSPQLALPPTEATHMAWIPACEDAMLLLYLFLVNALASHLPPPYSPGAYIEAAGVLNHGSWLGSLSQIGL